MNIYELVKACVDINEGVACINDGEFKSPKGDVEIYLYWHRPSINVGWYPIIEIIVGDHAVYGHKEFGEEPSRWLSDIVQYLSDMNLDWYKDWCVI